MIYMTILGLIALLSLKVGIGSINQLASERFIPGPSVREWGFIDNGEWKQHEQYLSERYKG